MKSVPRDPFQRVNRVCAKLSGACAVPSALFHPSSWRRVCVRVPLSLLQLLKIMTWPHWQSTHDNAHLKAKLDRYKIQVTSLDQRALNRSAKRPGSYARRICTFGATIGHPVTMTTLGTVINTTKYRTFRVWFCVHIWTSRHFTYLALYRKKPLLSSAAI